MLSLGEITDKLVIENIKLFNLREKLHTNNLSEQEYGDIYEKIMILNSNRSSLCKVLDEKLDKVSKGEKNTFLQVFKTYETDRKSK